MKIKDLTYHPQHPQKVWVVVEQPRNEPFRLRFDPASETFSRRDYKTLDRKFQGVYGWIGGTGTPPDPHLDVFLSTHQDPQPGAILAGLVIGIFFRADGDHKVAAIDEDWAATLSQPDISSLDEQTRANLFSQYPRVEENEGWYGTQAACAFLMDYPVSDWRPYLQDGSLRR
jgi:inorganic pyrophosphatase